MLKSEYAHIPAHINPLDTAEEIFLNKNWGYTRPLEDQLTLNVTATRGSYDIHLLWQEEFKAIQIFCAYGEFIYADAQLNPAHKAIHAINKTVWMGHFELNDDFAPQFRHTSFIQGDTETFGGTHISDMVEIAVAECDRNHAVFDMINKSMTMDDKTVSFLTRHSAGEA